MCTKVADRRNVDANSIQLERLVATSLCQAVRESSEAWSESQQRVARALANFLMYGEICSLLIPARNCDIDNIRYVGLRLDQQEKVMDAYFSAYMIVYPVEQSLLAP